VGKDINLTIPIYMMPIHPMKRIEDKTRDLVMWLDYYFYAMLNLLKVKPFPKKINRILVVELLKAGDLLVATPTIKALKEKWKDAKIDVLLLPETRELLKNNVDVNKLITYTTFQETRDNIKKNNYDLSITLHPGSLKVSWLLYKAKVKYRMGCTKSGITYGKGFLLNKKIAPNNVWQHKIEDNLDVVRSIGANNLNKKITLHIDKTAKKKVETLLRKYGKNIIGIHSPSQHKSQQWLPERFAEVADKLVKKYKGHIIFTGTKEDASYINNIISRTQQKQKMVNLAGKTTMQEYIAVINKLNLLISIDTGTIHIASATKTPIVALFGPTIPTFWGPSYEKSSVIWKDKEACVGCRKYTCVFNKDYECMRSITVNDVMQEVGKVFK
jgi:lipopolysaccharide heptosyltransferase II